MKYWLGTLGENVPLQRMVFEAKMRWRIGHDYQYLKQDLGLGHFEGRGWRGFHHHANLSIAAYGFLMAWRLRQRENAGKKKLHEAKNLPCPRITNMTYAKQAQASRLPQRHVVVASLFA